MNERSFPLVPHAPLLTVCGIEKHQGALFFSDLLQNLGEQALRILVLHPGKMESSSFQNISYACSNCDVLFSGSDDNKAGLAAESSLRKIVDQHVFGYDLILACREKGGADGALEFFTDGEVFGQPLYTLKTNADIAGAAASIMDWLSDLVISAPVWGCVLIGGKSSRMGKPKHLIEDEHGVSWLEKEVDCLARVTERIVLAGKGEVPDSLGGLERITDVAGVQGPLAGIIAMLRWNPHVSWLVAACDMPGLNIEGADWLLNMRKPGIWGIVPVHPESKRSEPLFAFYDFRSRILFEQLLASGVPRPSRICEDEKIITPQVPDHLAASWRNCNTPEDMRKL